MTDIGVFFLLPGLGGGTTSFTAHLHRALSAAGARPTIYRVKERGELDRPRQFGKYEGIEYRNVDVATACAIARRQPTIMSGAAAARHLPDPDLIRKLMRIGMRIVIHDPNEFKIYDHLGDKLPQRPICIRPTMKKFYPDAMWIPHPYCRTPLDVRRRPIAVSTARVASVKRPGIILEANRLLTKKYRVELRGAEHRLYSYGLQKKFPDLYRQSGQTFRYPLTFDAPVRAAADARLNVDMTYFPDDGGGTQYAQMEAMDAGTLCVMHQDWFRYGGEVKAGKHVLTVDGSFTLAGMVRFVLSQTDEHFEEYAARLRENCEKLLSDHAPRKIGKMYMEELR